MNSPFHSRPGLRRVLLSLGLGTGLAMPLFGQGLGFERWNGVSGNSVEFLRAQINQRAADATGTVPDAHYGNNLGDNYGVRLRGLLEAPVTGDYTFFVAGDDHSEVWLSPDDAPFDRELLAWSRHWTNPQQWRKFASQRSRVVRLEQGQSYYLEALMKEGGGGDHLSVGWHYVPAPVISETPWALADATWTPAGENTQFSVRGGDLWTTADAGAFRHREWTGDGEFIVRVSDLNNPHNAAKAGLMLREHDGVGSRHVSVYRNPGNRVEFHRRLAEDGPTTGSFHHHHREWLRLVREGDRITVSVSSDRIEWIGLGAITLENLPATVLVGTAATSMTGTSGNPLTGTFGPLQASPLLPTGIIPGHVLTPYTGHPDDQDGSGLPSDWKIAHGLDPQDPFGDNGPYGDPDRDGRPNFLEYQMGSDPNVAETVEGRLTRELWANIVGRSVESLTDHNRFFETPDEVALAEGVNFLRDGNTLLKGARYRGKLVAPVTGSYRFWITGDDGAELWLADGTISPPGGPANLRNRFGKRRIAFILDERFGTEFTPRLDFDRFPSQRSAEIHLNEGDEYYFEVLHKAGGGREHVAVAWQPPGQSRHIIPSEHFLSHVPSPEDLSGDNLPDAWKSAVGLDPADNGRLDRNQGQNGDPDGDGLTNLQEYQFGTNPLSADTDGDGLSDFDEIFYFGTDPLVPNHIAPAIHATLPPHDYADASGYWTRDASGTLTAMDRRSEISYTFTVGTGEAGVFEVEVTGGAAGTVRPTETLSLAFSLNGSAIGSGKLVSLDGASNTTRVLTPWLPEGTHTLTILHDNFRAALRLRIDAIVIRSLGGLDLNEDGVPDWAAERLAAGDFLSRIPTASRTSPVTIEGKTTHFHGMALSAGGSPVTAQTSINGGFFANVPLDETGPVTLDASFHNGAVTSSHQIEWLPTNLFEHDELHIRQGDALRLDAWSGEGADQEPFTVTLGGLPLAVFNQSNPPDATDLVSGGWGNYRGFSVTFDDQALDTDGGTAAGIVALNQLTVRRSGSSMGTVSGDPAQAILKVYTSQTPTEASWVGDSVNTGDMRGGISETNVTFSFDHLELDAGTKYWFYFANTAGGLPTGEIAWTQGRLRVNNHSSHTYSSGNLINGSWGNQDTAWDALIAATFTYGLPLTDAAENTTHSSGEPFAATFDQAGTFTLVASHDGQTHPVTLHVHAASFGPPLSVRAYDPRSWTPAMLGRDLIVQADNRLSLSETTAAQGPRSFMVSTYVAGLQHTLARLPEDIEGAPGAIVARGDIAGFYLAYLDETWDAEVVTTYPDGTTLMRGSMVVVGLPPDIAIRITSYYQGVLFVNGSNVIWLTAEDFDQNGLTTIYFEWAGEGKPMICNYLGIYLLDPEN